MKTKKQKLVDIKRKRDQQERARRFVYEDGDVVINDQPTKTDNQGD